MRSASIAGGRRARSPLLLLALLAWWPHFPAPHAAVADASARLPALATLRAAPRRAKASLPELAALRAGARAAPRLVRASLARLGSGAASVVGISWHGPRFLLPEAARERLRERFRAAQPAPDWHALHALCRNASIVYFSAGA